jgi:hypothetical protein
MSWKGDDTAFFLTLGPPEKTESPGTFVEEDGDEELEESSTVEPTAEKANSGFGVSLRYKPCVVLTEA